MKLFVRIFSKIAFALLLAASLGPLLYSQQNISEVMNDFKNYDLDSDGTDEIKRLDYLDFESINSDDSVAEGRLVLILIEGRLLKTLKGSEFSKADLVRRFKQYKSDLVSEGFVPHFIRCDVYSGKQHQDGLTVLAMRRFLQAVDKKWDLNGVVLVGSFPEPMIVRRWIWRREKWNVTIAGKAYKGNKQRPFLRIVPELVAPRADIVLADLDGNWEDIYVKEPRQLESIEALPPEKLAEWPVDGMVFESRQFNDESKKFEDFFFIKEDDYHRLDSAPGVLKLKLNLKQRHPEVSETDRRRANPIAFPDILVSRINPRHVAVVPQKNFRDLDGRGLLDSRGVPQVFETSRRVKPANLLVRDPVFERRLLIDYFDRNHRFRSESVTDSNRTAAASYGRGLISASRLNKYLQPASNSFEKPVAFNNASLLDYVNFLKSPARLKAMSAHSNPWNSAYGKKYELKILERSLGGSPWRWKEEKSGSRYRYRPSLADQGGAADSYVHRTIYENDLLSNGGGTLFIHNGCEVNTPGNASRVPYNHNDYASAHGFQNAESILFFLNGVALASRSKVFYDTPREFTAELGRGPKRCFGDGWRAYFQVESEDPALAERVASNKRTYPWSVIGDWTLRVKSAEDR